MSDMDTIQTLFKLNLINVNAVESVDVCELSLAQTQSLIRVFGKHNWNNILRTLLMTYMPNLQTLSQSDIELFINCIVDILSYQKDPIEQDVIQYADLMLRNRQDEFCSSLHTYTKEKSVDYFFLNAFSILYKAMVNLGVKELGVKEEVPPTIVEKVIEVEKLVQVEVVKEVEKIIEKPSPHLTQSSVETQDILVRPENEIVVAITKTISQEELDTMKLNSILQQIDLYDSHHTKMFRDESTMTDLIDETAELTQAITTFHIVEEFETTEAKEVQVVEKVDEVEGKEIYEIDEVNEVDEPLHKQGCIRAIIAFFRRACGKKANL